MRIIAGKFRSRPLRTLPGNELRPTSDKLRGTLFNVLTAGNPDALVGSVWLDLFAGTGAVGIEAISRGAAMVYFADSSLAAAELIRQNLASFKIDKGFLVLKQAAGRALADLRAKRIAPDYVFLDPPYLMQAVYRETLQSLSDSGLLRPATLVIVEHEKRFDPGQEFAALRRSRKLVQGDAALSFYQLQ
jgi:16S rRNA (guanine(966)-N(2))-methyltransferase RsmD